jgi:hypothetical protein
MQSHYGYIKGTVGKDKDHLDVFVKPGTPEDYDGDVYIVNQVDPKTRKFDEHKIIMGSSGPGDAVQMYRDNYAKDWKGLGSIGHMPMKDFKEWLKSGDTKKPALMPGDKLQHVNPPPTPDQATTQPVQPQPKPPKSKVTKSKDEKPIAAVPFSPAAQKQDESGNPEFDYSDLPKRPTVKMIIGDWRKAGRPKSFTTTYGEGFARFNFEELHGIPQWWDEGNGAGIDRNRVLDALKAEKFEEEQPATPDNLKLSSPPREEPKVSFDKEEKQPEPAPPAPTPDQAVKENPKEAPIAVPTPNFDDMRSSAMDAQMAFSQARTLEEKQKHLERVLSLRKEFKDQPGFIGGAQYYSRLKFFDEMVSRMNQAVEDFKPAPPTPEAVAPKEKPATIPPPTPEEVSNERTETTNTIL